MYYVYKIGVCVLINVSNKNFSYDLWSINMLSEFMLTLLRLRCDRCAENNIYTCMILLVSINMLKNHNVQEKYR